MKTFHLLTVTIAITIGSATLLIGSEPKPCCANPSLTETEQPAPTLSDASIYQVESTWTNDLGATMQLRDLRGEPQVITMFFARCEYACPILAHDMKRIEEALPENVRSSVGFTLVTFDTERDSVEELAKFRQRQELGAKWTLMRGASDDVLELAALLGIKFKKDARGQFAHSNVILVLNAEGEIVHQQLGLNQPVETTVEVIRNLKVPAVVTTAQVQR